MSNAVMFKDYLTKVNIPMAENKDEAGSVFFRTKQDLRSGGTVLMVISFPPEDGFVDLDIFGLADVKNPAKINQVYALMNELNENYRYAKFTEANGMVNVKYSYCVAPSALDPAGLMNMMIVLLGMAEDSAPRFAQAQQG